MPIRGLEQIVLDQAEVFSGRDPGTTREVDFERYMRNQQIVVVSGVRRCGKSTLLRQFAERYDRYYYVNFDDERLISFTVENFSELMLCLRKQHESDTIFIDEVQNVDKWERFVRRIQDEGYKIYLTGSNARLLSSELGTHLTGRYSKIELFPFSFSEYLAFYHVNYHKLTSANEASVLTHFDNYLVMGSFPEYLKYADKEFLARTYEDILHRDIITRKNIRDVKSFLQLCHYLFSCFTRDLSYNALARTLGINSSMTVKSYIQALQESYLAFELYKYDYSLKKQLTHSKKAYVVDNGMRNTVAFGFSEDRGSLLENLVYLSLRRRGENIYMFRETRECDFLIERQGRIVEAIQVCYEINDTNGSREIQGLIQAMDKLNCPKGRLLTYNQQTADWSHGEPLPAGVEIQPVWRWLLCR